MSGYFSSRERLQNRYRQLFFKIARRRTVLAIAAVFVLIAIFKGAIIGLALLFAIGGISMVWKRKLRGFPFGFELVTFTTTIASVVYGPLTGAMFGILTAMAAQAGANDYDAGMVFFFAGTMTLGLFAGFLYPTLPLIVLVPLMGLISDAFTQFLAVMGTYEQRFVSLIYVITHLFVNVMAAKLIGAALLGFVSANYI